jgi:hypothetical protein
MHANHAASRNQPPPVDIPVRSGTSAAPTFAQALGATASSRGTTSGPGSGRFPQGASPNRGGFQFDPQSWTANHFLRTENAVSNFTPMPTRRARLLTGTTPSWGTPFRRAWTTLIISSNFMSPECPAVRLTCRRDLPTSCRTIRARPTGSASPHIPAEDNQPSYSPVA